MHRQLVKIFLTFTFLIFSSNIFAQTASPIRTKLLKDNESLLGIEKEIESELESILLNDKMIPLMFDKEESQTLDRVVESLNNGQTYSPIIDENDSELLQQQENARLAKEFNEQKNLESEKSFIYLSSIMYFSPKNWIIWIGDKKITPENNDKKNELYVTSIKKDRVTILWTLSISKWKVLSGQNEEKLAKENKRNNQVLFKFRLKTNQTYILGSNSVVEGKTKTSLTRQKRINNSTQKRKGRKIEVTFE